MFISGVAPVLRIRSTERSRVAKLYLPRSGRRSKYSWIKRRISARPQGADLRGAAFPHRLCREASLPQRHASHIERAGELVGGDGDRRRLLLCRGEAGRERKSDAELQSSSHPIPKSSRASRAIIASMAFSGMRGRLVFSTMRFTARSASMVCCGVVNG